MVATPKIFKTGIDLEGNILKRPKMDTATGGSITVTNLTIEILDVYIQG